MKHSTDHHGLGPLHYSLTLVDETWLTWDATRDRHIATTLCLEADRQRCFLRSRRLPTFLFQDAGRVSQAQLTPHPVLVPVHSSQSSSPASSDHSQRPYAHAQPKQPHALNPPPRACSSHLTPFGHNAAFLISLVFCLVLCCHFLLSLIFAYCSFVFSHCEVDLSIYLPTTRLRGATALGFTQVPQQLSSK